MDSSDLPKSRRAVLLVDFVNPLDFPGAEEMVPFALAAARRTSVLLAEARRAGIPVIYANDNFGRWRSDFPTMVRRLAGGSGPSARMVRLIRPRRGDLTVLKPMHSAFFGSPLDILLQKMHVRSLVLAGLATDICVQLTAADAFLRSLKVHVPADCTAAESERKWQTSLDYMREILRCNVAPWAGF